jgi:ABC-type branched-subunit amino acid transport system substrate-binding protein
MAQIAVEKANAKPDYLRGYQISLTTVDSGGLASVGASALIDTMYRQPVDIVIGGADDAVALNAALAAEAFNVPFLSYGATSDYLTDKTVYPNGGRTIRSVRPVLRVVQSLVDEYR